MESFWTIFIIALIWSLSSQSKKKRKRKARGIDSEYRELVETHMQARENGLAVKEYLLQVLDGCQNDREKFSDAMLKRADELYEQVGPGGFYWMAEIASQFILLSAAEINEIPTSVDNNLSAPVTPVQLVNEVVRVNY